MKKNLLGILIDFFEAVFIGAAIFIVTFIFAGQLLEVNGESMYPTFKDKEQLIVEKLTIKFKPIQRGEILVFQHPKEQRLLIKRLIGLPGEEIAVKDGGVFINGIRLTEDYLPSDLQTEGRSFLEEKETYKIPFDSYIFMGDNREKSTDSREWGPVREDLIVGRGVLVYYPKESSRLLR